MEFKPLGNRMLVRRIKEEDTMKNGLYIPDTAKEKPQEGEVLAVGPGKLNEAGVRIALEIAVGDRVLFGKYNGTEIKMNGEPLLILEDHEIYGLLLADPIQIDTAAFTGAL